MEELNPWTRKIPWSRKWQLTPIFLTGKSHGQRSLVGCSPGCRKKLDMTERLSTYTYISQVPSKGTEISLKISEIEGVCHTGNGRAMRSNWGWWTLETAGDTTSSKHIIKSRGSLAPRKPVTISCWNHLETILSELKGEYGVFQRKEGKYPDFSLRSIL